MANLTYLPLPTNQVRALQNGLFDANGHTPERHISDGNGNTCRHCLTEIDQGDEFLVVAHRPFSTCQPYAEQGPVFLHAKECPSYLNTLCLPKFHQRQESLLLRGYDKDERIVSGTGQTVRTDEIDRTAQ
jgi:Protein of unknown function (DUF1203)